MSDDCDVLVIGGGVAGALFAWKLASELPGVRIVVLEAGPEIVPDDAMRALEARIGVTGEFAVDDARGPGAPYRQVAFDGPEGRDYTDPSGTTWPNGSSYFVQSKPKDFRSTYERAVGGSTWHFLGNVPRFVPADFEMKTRYGRGTDWPFGYQDLEQDYVEAERALGVSGNHEQWDALHGGKRSEPFPMSEIWPSYSDLLVEERTRGLEIDGTRVVVMRTPQARNARPYDGRPACAGNSSCVPICPIGAKYDAGVHVRKARAAGVDVRPRAVVTRLHAKGDRIESVDVVYWQPTGVIGPETSIKANIVVLAGGAIETPRLLLVSRVANASKQVGKNLMDHANRFGWIRAREPVYPFRGPPTTSGIDAFRDGAFRTDRAAFRLSIGNDGAGRNNAPDLLVESLVSTKRLYGAALRERLRVDSAGLLRISSSTEILPAETNFVDIDPSNEDRFKMPRPKLEFAIDDYTKAGYLKADAVIDEMLKRVGSDAPPKMEDVASWSGAGHIMGTTRMGVDRSKSVVDPNCRAHDVVNADIPARCE